MFAPVSVLVWLFVGPRGWISWRTIGAALILPIVWLLFALSAFGSLFGFVGMLVAVPVAAAIGVFARAGIQQYQSSLLYKGYAGRVSAPPDQKDEAAE